MKAQVTQGEAIAQHLKLVPHTYAQMLAIGVSCAPWKRCAEWLDRHPEWALQTGKVSYRGRELVTWRVVKRKALQG